MNFKVDAMKLQLELIVRAIQKGVGEDIREYKNSTNKATNNAIALMRADNINTNLRDSVVSETLELKYFKRSSWTGCLLIDRKNKLTITICSKQTLERIPRKKGRNIPHYLQTILHIENSKVDYILCQPVLFDYPSTDIFSEDVYREDYRNIMEEDVSFDDDYAHWVVVYEASHYVVTSVAMKKLDPYFRIAQEIKLDDLLTPDFGDLTKEYSNFSHSSDVHSLVSVKPKKYASNTKSIRQKSVAKPRKTKEEKHA